MRKKHERKHKKRREANAPIDAEKLGRLEAIKAKREETIAMVKRRLDDKFNERFAITRANMLRDDHDRQKKQRGEAKSLNEQKMIEIREEMKKVLSAGVESVHSAKVLEDKVKFDSKSATMTVCGKKYKIKKNVHMVGWGLEALMVGSAFEKIIGDNLKRGWLVVPRRTIGRMSIYPEWFPRLDTRIIFSEAASENTPDEVCVQATRNIIDYCKKLKKNDILMVLLSTSADDLMCLPRGTVGLREKMKLLEELRVAGATTREIGVVRTCLSAVRGGGLARSAYPAKVISLVMSDAGPADLHLNRIAGGPTINEVTSSTRSAALRILSKYDLRPSELPQGIQEVLTVNQDPTTSSLADQSKMTDDHGHFKFVSDCIVASSKEAMDAMAIATFRLGYSSIKLAASASIGSITESPNVRKVVKEYTKIISLLILATEDKITKLEMYEAMRHNKIFDISEKKLLEIFPSKDKWARGLYVLIGPPPIFEKPGNLNGNDELTPGGKTGRNQELTSGGKTGRNQELTTGGNTGRNQELPPGGKTGRNQELALYFSLYWYLKTEQHPILKEYVVWFLGCASCGRDGNTDFSGAYGYGNLGVDVYRQFRADFPGRSEPPVDRDVKPDGPAMIPRLDGESTELDAEERRAIHEAILPDRVLADGNANLQFRNVNDGQELLSIGDAAGYTFTNVGDLHAFRVARYQCSCDGFCLRRE